LQSTAFDVVKLMHWHFISFILAVSEFYRAVVIGICAATACREVWKWCNI